MEVRKLTLHELKDALCLIDEFERKRSPWPGDEQLEQILADISHGGGCIVGALVDNTLVGTCTINVCANLSWSGRPYAIIENVIVTKSQRNRGTGKALLTFAKDYCRDLGCYKVALMAGSKKDDIHHFYRAAGFEGTKTGYQVRFT